MTNQPPPPAFDLMFLRERAMDCRLTDEELTALTGIPTADWHTRLTPQTLPAAALFPLARALNTSPESLLRVPEKDTHRPGPGMTTHATVLHAALLEAGRIHPDDLACALEWPPHRLKRAATTLAAHLDQPTSPHRLVHTDTTIHLTTAPGLLTPRQRQNLHSAGHTAASLAPDEAAAVTRLLHRTASGLPPDVSPQQIPRLANRRLLAPSVKQPSVHPDVLFALGLAPHPLTDLPEPAGHQAPAPCPDTPGPGPPQHVHHPGETRADSPTDGPAPWPTAATPQPSGPR